MSSEHLEDWLEDQEQLALQEVEDYENIYANKQRNKMVNMDHAEIKVTVPVGLEMAVLEFMGRAGQLEHVEFGNYHSALRGERIAMMIGDKGEVKEYMEAEINDDLVETLDGLADIMWVALGTMFKYVGPECALEVMQEVARSNLAKVDGSLGEILWSGEPGNSKILKPEGWIPPDVRGVLERHGWRLNEKGQPVNA